MGKFYIINAPWAFTTVWSLVKGWLDEATVAKIHILSTDYKKTLFEQMSPDSLPAFLGGNCKCPEGCSMSDAGPWKGHIGSSIKSKKAASTKLIEDEVSTEQVTAGIEGLKVNGDVVNV